MAGELPPDLSRIGDEIVAAAHRTIGARRRRVMLALRAAVCVAAALLVAAGVPSMVGPAERTTERLLLVSSGGEGERRPGCDRPRTATFAYRRPCRRTGEGHSIPAQAMAEFALVERRAPR